MIRKAISSIYTEGRKLTYDIASRIGVSPVNTIEFTKEVIRKIKEFM